MTKFFYINYKLIQKALDSSKPNFGNCKVRQKLLAWETMQMRLCNTSMEITKTCKLAKDRGMDFQTKS